MLNVQKEVFRVGDKVRSLGGWEGKVERVLNHHSGRLYVVRWDKTGEVGRIAPCNLQRAA